MRATSLVKKLLNIKCIRVLDVSFSSDGLVCDVAPTTRVPRCGACGCRARGYDRRTKARHWRHLDFGGMRVELRYRIRRVDCRRCGVTTELVPWAAHNSWFTLAFEDTVAFLAQAAAKTVVSEMMRVAWVTVGSIIRAVVARRGGSNPLDGLAHIGVDELSYRKHHEYVTIVVDHMTGNVVWARPGKNADTLKSFFEELGPERAAALENITMDMSQAYIKAVREVAPQVNIVFDRFHVQRLAHVALDEVRRAEVREISEPKGRAALKKTRFALQKRPWNLTAVERTKVTDVKRANRRLYTAYLLRESLAAILDRRQQHVARAKLEEWTMWASHSALKPFVRVARTIRTHIDGIVGYIATGLSNARSEGLNRKARAITHRSFGFHSASSLIAMLFLCCSGLRLTPAHVVPSTH